MARERDPEGIPPNRQPDHHYVCGACGLMVSLTFDEHPTAPGAPHPHPCNRGEPHQFPPAEGFPLPEWVDANPGDPYLAQLEQARRAAEAQGG